MNRQTKNLTLMAMFIAIEILMCAVPFLGYIPIGPLRATLLHVPVIIAGIVLGRKQGAFVGAVFGITSIVMNTISPTVTSFAFSPLISGNLLSAVIALVPRILIGFVAGVVYDLLRHKTDTLAMALGSFFGAMTNTILVLGGIYLFFGKPYAEALGKSASELLPYFLGIISTNSLLEAVVGVIIGTAVSKALLRLNPRRESSYMH